MAGVELEETRRSVSFDAVAGALEQPPSAARATSEETEYVPGPADLMANVHEDIRQRPRFRKLKSLGHIVSSRSPRKRFDMTQLPEDIQRVQKHLQRRFGEEYSLHIVFVIRTAVELHRAWHMTLLTSKIMQQLKDKFQLRTTWTLGVLRLKFRIEDGDYELHRKVPYDYDSEFQDKYTRIAVALIEGHIDVHRALQYQVETKQGLHTAVRLFSATTGPCCSTRSRPRREAGKLVIDITVGTSTGVIAGHFYIYDGGACLSSIFLGTLYWFFYGTAFVIGLLEIIAGELETGVTRFIAVSVKTFVLCLGAGFGMMITLKDPSQKWVDQADYCGRLDLKHAWWRIPLYLLCSASALGQYRFPIVDYWRGLIVQLVAYEVQYQLLVFFEKRHDKDNLDYAASNVAGAMAAVVCACVMSFFVDHLLRRPYYNRILQREGGTMSLTPKLEKAVYNVVTFAIKVGDCLGLGRKTEPVKRQLAKKLRQRQAFVLDPNRPETEVKLDDEEENILVETVIGAQDLSIWAQLMPAVYQLVPGSMIAKLWFNSIFPPPLDLSKLDENDPKIYNDNDVFSNLMVISTSLALGLVLGFVAVRIGARFFFWLCCCCGPSCSDEILNADDADDDLSDEEHALAAQRRQTAVETRDRYDGMFTSTAEDPKDGSSRGLRDAPPDEEAGEA
ncbi:hypothetical protein JL721_3749 [Aureococcus anophagefferens]|nr:hypothetical protein JL721_3749 [Aureococcus anophagefferens]